MTQLKSKFQEFIADAGRHQLYEREALALNATELIYELIEKEGVSKTDLAKRLGKSKAYITQLLSGSRNMTINTLAEVAFALGYKIDLSASPMSLTQAGAYVWLTQDEQDEQVLFGSYSLLPAAANLADINDEDEEGGYSLAA